MNKQELHDYIIRSKDDESKKLEQIKNSIKQGIVMGKEKNSIPSVCIQKNYLNIIDYIITECHIDLDTQHYFLSYSAAEGQLDIVQYFIKKGLDISYKKEYASLVNSSKNGHLPIVQYLLNQIKNPTQKNIKSTIESISILDICLYYGTDGSHKNIIEFVLSLGANIHHDRDLPLQQAIWKKNFEMMIFLIEKGANIENVVHVSEDIKIWHKQYLNSTKLSQKLEQKLNKKEPSCNKIKI